MQRVKEDSSEVQEYVKTLELITDFSKLKEGDKIFNRKSLSVEYVDTFIEYAEDEEGRQSVCYKNYFGETWWGKADGYWYYVR